MSYQRVFIDFLESIRDFPRIFIQSKGYLYFIPALILLLLYLWISGLSNDAVGGLTWMGGIPWIGDWLMEKLRDAQTLLDKAFWQLTKLLAISILAPVNTLSSTSAETAFNGKRFPFYMGEFIHDVWRSILIIITAMFLQGFLWLFIFLITWTLDWDMIGEVLLFLLSAFFYGFAYYDYSFERHRFKLGKSWEMAFDNIPAMILVGVVYSSLFNIPYAGIVVAPTICAILSTIFFLRGRASGSFKL